MNNEPEENLDIDKESQVLIDKLIAEDMQYAAAQEKSTKHTPNSLS